LRVPPALGRTLEPSDDSLQGGAMVAVLSHSFWERRFHSDPNVIGQIVLIDERPNSVVGDRKSTRLNSSHLGISYAAFCLKKKNTHFAAPPPPPRQTSDRRNASARSSR